MTDSNTSSMSSKHSKYRQFVNLLLLLAVLVMAFFLAMFLVGAVMKAGTSGDLGPPVHHHSSK